VFSVCLVVLTNRILSVPAGPAAIIAGLLVGLVAAIVAMGLAFGALHPKLDTGNAAQIATGFGAMVYMAACLGLTFVVVAVAAWPIGRLLRAAGDGFAVSTAEATGMGVCLTLAVTIALAATVVARRRGIAALARLG
jgi:hypothetical protein